jgi:hypothetical protein
MWSRYLAVSVLLCAGVAGWAGDRRVLPVVMAVPETAITVDGADADWRALGESFSRTRLTPNLPQTFKFYNADQGDYSGAEDCSYAVWLAMDAHRVYLLAHVTDQLLINDAVLGLYEGDDLELFIDANPPAQRFQAQRNENCRQFIFVPNDVSSSAVGNGTVWTDKPVPGLVMASRLHTWGYTIEAAVPKAAFPYWKEHPEMQTFGGDVSVSDADAAGVDGPHGPMKYIVYLLNGANHFQTNQGLSQLEVTPDMVRPGKRIAVPVVTAAGALNAIRTATPATAVQAADGVLALIGAPAADAAAVATAAVASPHPPLRKAGLLLFAKRPELTAPVVEIARGLTQAQPDGYYLDPALASYALIALARRHQLPACEAWYGPAANVAVKQTYLWCLGVNGDRAATPYLISQLSDKNLRIRLKAARALGALADPAALPALRTMADKDHHYAQNVAKEILAVLEKPSGGK